MSRYLAERQKLKLTDKSSSKQLKEDKKIKGDWFSRQIEVARKLNACENCGCSLRPTMAVNPAAVVAHILSKSKAPSVAYVNTNRLFLCDSCHGKYDSASSEEIQAMSCFQIAYDRIAAFKHLIPANEMRFCPDCFL